MYVPPFLPSFIIGYASIHIVFIYVTTFGNESEHNSHITILVFHTTSDEAERIYTGPPFIFPNKHSNMQSRERERKKPTSQLSVNRLSVTRPPFHFRCEGICFFFFYWLHSYLMLTSEAWQDLDASSDTFFIQSCHNPIFPACTLVDLKYDECRLCSN